jgi:ADP-ribose pyrophosphatase
MSAEIVARQQTYHGKIVDLELQTLRLQDGRIVQNEVVVHRPCVAMVAVAGDGRLLFVRQFRAPAEADLLEIAAGSIDADEDVEAAVQRELQEEVGMRAERLQRLGAIYSAPGYCTELIHIYVCEGLIESRLPADEDEVIEVEQLTLNEALDLVASGDIRDAKTVAGLLLYARTRS